MHPPFVPYPFTAQRHAATPPPRVAGAGPVRHPVVVVGGGPVGYCTALGLVRQGVPVVLLEADDSVCVGSRAICISRRSLEIFQRLGALEGFLKIGLPWTGGRSFYRDTEVLHFQMPQDENQKLPPMLNLAQYSIEQILLDALLEVGEAQPGLVDIRWLNKVTGMELLGAERAAVHGAEQGAEVIAEKRAEAGAEKGADQGTAAEAGSGVRLSVSTPAGAYTLLADWVVACDGGRSTMRDALKLPLQGNSYEGRYVIVDILMKSARPTERLAYFDPPCNRGSTVLVHKQPRDVWRIDYQLQDGEDPEAAVLPENVLPRVQSLLAMMGETAPWNPIWMGLYKANALTLANYCHGRVLFAGDAAHLLPIFGVRGANSGIDDADNLSWKLAYVVKGWANAKLLGSYSQERVAAAHENMRHGSKSTEFMAPPSFAFDLMRQAVLGLAAAHPQVSSLINPRQSSAITYSSSALNAAPARQAGFSAGPVHGAVVPECPVTHLKPGAAARAGFLTELLQPCFTALVFVDEPVLPRAIQAWVQTVDQRCPWPLRLVLLSRQRGDASLAPSHSHAWDHTGWLFPMFGAVPGSLYVLRPDGHVLGRWLHGVSSEAVSEVIIAIDHALMA
jgi:3-(3-hydroxy-phenyl)propionate hydroxylase